jgi:hypothetical protein
MGLIREPIKHGMLTYSVVLLHDNARPYTPARNRALLGHFNWDLLYHTAYSPSLSPCDHNLLTYLKNWLWWRRFSNNEELTEGVKTWPRLWVANFFDTGTHKNLLPDTNSSIPAAITLRSSLGMDQFFNIIFYLIVFFLTAHRMSLSEWPSHYDILWIIINFVLTPTF